MVLPALAFMWLEICENSCGGGDRFALPRGAPGEEYRDPKLSFPPRPGIIDSVASHLDSRSIGVLLTKPREESMELKIKSILFATGLGANAGYVLDHALSLAQKYQARIHVLYGLDIMRLSTQSKAELYPSQIELEDSIEKLLQERESHIRGELQGLCHERLVKLNADEALIAGIDIERKPAKQAILDAAAQYRADLIVMGAQRRATAGAARLGPTTVKVLNRATVPVVVVKGSAGPND